LPRCFWFIEPDAACHPGESAPFVETSTLAHKGSTGRWQIRRRGRVEREYFFETVLARHILPFSVLERTLLFLPLAVAENMALLLGSADLVARGTLYAASFVKETEQVWQSRGEDRQKALREVLDSNRSLSRQDPRRSMVLLSRFGVNPAAALCIRREDVVGWAVSGFVADHETYYCYPETEEEGDYLCAVLNSFPSQKRTRFTAATAPSKEKKHSAGLPFDLSSIPAYDKGNPEHARLATLARECRIAGENAIQKNRGKSVNMRPMVIRKLKKHLFTISQIVRSSILSI
jgi:hypothetical protein